jgi:hypothetical protein
VSGFPFSTCTTTGSKLGLTPLIASHGNGTYCFSLAVRDSIRYTDPAAAASCTNMKDVRRLEVGRLRSLEVPCHDCSRATVALQLMQLIPSVAPTQTKVVTLHPLKDQRYKTRNPALSPGHQGRTRLQYPHCHR